jgi:diacylglycerol kinase family enzyme
MDLIRELRACGLRPRLFRNRERMARWLAVPDHRAQVLCLVAAGGDGTVNDLVNRFPGLPLAILPMGTENLLARYLDVPHSGAELARLIAGGERRRLDLGLLEPVSDGSEPPDTVASRGRRFVLMLSAGFDADVVQRVHSARRGNISHGTYLQPILESLRTYDYPELQVTIDDESVPHTARLVEVVNLPAYALGLPVASGARGDDSRLDLRLFERGAAFQMIRYLCNVAMGTHEQLPDVQSLTAKRIRIDAERPVPLQADGDPVGYTPVEILLLPGALEVFAPRSSELAPGDVVNGPGVHPEPSLPRADV